MSDINEVRGRLERDASGFLESDTAVSDVTDLRTLLDDHARLRGVAEELERFRSLARWVSNSAGHGINSNQRRLGEELLVLIDAAKAVQP